MSLASTLGPHEFAAVVRRLGPERGSAMIQIPEYTIEPRVEVAAATTALLIVDMQNDFVDPQGRLYVPGAQNTVPVIAGLLATARAHEMSVIYTQDWHEPDDPEAVLWGPHAEAGTWGAEIVPALAPRAGELVVRKVRYDGFYGTPLEHELHRRRIDTLIVVGTVSNICVLHTAGSAALRWFRVIVPVDAVSALTEFDQHATFRQIAFLYRGTLVPSGGIAVRAR